MSEPLGGFFDSIPRVCGKLMTVYWKPIYDYLDAHPEFVQTVPGFLVRPEKIIFYFGRTHLGIEYVGPERIDELSTSSTQVLVGVFDYTQSSKDLLELIIGFNYAEDSNTLVPLPLPPLSEGLLWPTNRGMDKLSELHWHYDAQNFILVINSPGFMIPQGQFSRIVNGLFFDADDDGLKTRRIKWLDLVPVFYDDSGEESDTFAIDFGPYSNLVEPDCNYTYPMPEDFRLEKLTQINRFIELIGDVNTTEPEITRFLAEEENQLIMSMLFGATEVHSEVDCEWQSEERDNIRPDFFVVQPNGYGDIVEFKLPHLSGRSIVGRANRETFSAKINSYISQTRVYRVYFEDPNNRKWFASRYGYNVYRPKRILVIGRRWDFSTEEWLEIAADHQGLTIMTYDDLIDGVVAQFYM